MGRSPIGWMDDIKEETGLFAIGATRLAADRRRWSTQMIATPAHVRQHDFRERERDQRVYSSKKLVLNTSPYLM